MTLKRAFKGAIDLTGPAWEVQKELGGMPSLSKTEGAFGAEIDALKNMKKLGLMVAGAAAKYQMDGKIDLKDDQEITMNIADIMMDVFVAESILLRVQKLEHLGKDTDALRMMLNGVKRFTKYEVVNVKNARRAIAKKLIGDNAYSL